MKSNISIDEDNIISSPLLFTPSQKENKRRKLCHTGSFNNSLRFLSPTTPGLGGLCKSPDLPEEAREHNSSRKSKDDFFLIEILRSNKSKRENESIQSCSEKELHKWLFDTPSILKSPTPLRHQGVSRRSLDGILDPDVSFEWVESMATPPSESSEKELDVIPEEDHAIPQATSIEKTDPAVNEDATEKSIKPEKQLCLKKVKKGVARVLFDFGTHEEDQVTYEEEQVEDCKPDGDSKTDEDLPFLSSSEEDESCSLSPPVVNTQDAIVCKGVTVPKSAAMFSRWTEGEPRAQVIDVNNGLRTTQCSQRQATAYKNEREMTSDLDKASNVSINELTGASGESKALSAVLSSPSIVSKSHYAKDSQEHPSSNLQSASGFLDKNGNSLDVEDTTLPGSPTVVSSRKSKRYSKDQTEAYLFDSDTKVPTSVKSNNENASGRPSCPQHRICFDDAVSESRRTNDEIDIDPCTEAVAVHSSPTMTPLISMITSLSHSKLGENRFEIPSIYRTPEKLSVSNISGISETSCLSPTVVSNSKRNVNFTPFTSRAQLIRITESTPKISKLDIVPSDTTASDISLHDCPVSPTVVKTSNYSSSDILSAFDDPLKVKDAKKLFNCDTVRDVNLQPMEKHEKEKTKGSDRNRDFHLDKNASSSRQYEVTNQDSKCRILDSATVEAGLFKSDQNSLEEKESICNVVKVVSRLIERLPCFGPSEKDKHAPVTLVKDPETICPLVETKFSDLASNRNNSVCTDDIAKGYDSCLLKAEDNESKHADKYLCKNEMKDKSIIMPDRLEMVASSSDNVVMKGKKLYSNSSFEEGEAEKSCIESILSHKEDERSSVNQIEIRSLNDISLLSANDSFMEHGICKNHSDESLPLDQERNVDNLNLDDGFVLNCTLAADDGLNEVHQSARAGVMQYDEPSKIFEADRRERSLNALCENNIVDMDLLTQFPHDELNSLFCCKEKAVLGRTHSDSKPVAVYSHSLENRNIKNLDLQKEACDQVELEQDIRSNCGNIVCGVNEERGCIENVEFLKGNNQLMQVMDAKCHPLQVSECTLDAEKFSIPKEHRLVGSKSCETRPRVKQSRQLSDSSTEDMLDELMFGRNGPRPKRKKIDVDFENSSPQRNDFNDEQPIVSEQSNKRVEYSRNRSKGQSHLQSNILSVKQIERPTRLSASSEKQTGIIGNNTSFFEEHSYDIENRQVNLHDHLPGNGCLQISEAEKEILSDCMMNNDFHIEDFTQLRDTEDDFRQCPALLSKAGKEQITLPSSTEKAMKAAKKRLETVENSGNDHLDSSKKSGECSKFVGFSTGTGKKVEISEKAMKAAKKRLETVENSGNDNLDSAKKSAECSKFVGFSTGTGRKVEISEKAMMAAKKRLESVENSGNVDLDSSKKSAECSKFAGFCTGTGRKIEISEKAMQAAKKRLESVENSGNIDLDSSKKSAECSKFVGFSTGTGKKVEISEKAMKAAKKRLETVENSGNDNLDSAKQSAECSKFVGFITGTGKKVEISEKAMKAAKKRLETVENSGYDNLDSSKQSAECSKFVGFSTGTGRKVEISEKAMKAAKKRLESVENSGNVDLDSSKKSGECSKFVGFSTGTGKKVEISEKAMKAAKKRLETVENSGNDHLDSSMKSAECSKFVGFSTGTGRKVEISEKAMKAAKKRLETVENSANVDLDSSKKSGECSKFVGFSTGTGRKVEISEKAMKAAKKRLETVENSGNDNLDSSKKSAECSKFAGCSTGTGKKVEISEKAMKAAKKRLETVENSGNDNLDSSMENAECSKFVGFSTGTGKKVEISEKAMKAAKKRLEPVENCDNEDFDSVKILSDKNVKRFEEAFEEAKQGSEEDEECKKIWDDSRNENYSAKRYNSFIKDLAVDDKANHSLLDNFNDELVEMSERFDEDMIKTIEENPCFLNVRRRKTVVGKKTSSRSVESNIENRFDRSEEREEARSNSDFNDSSTRTSAQRATPNLRNESINSRASLSGLKSKSKFTFKAKSSTPAGYRSDRLAKFTTPLIAKNAYIEDNNTLMLSRSAPAVSKNILQSISSATTHGTTDNIDKNHERIGLRSKSFCTPFNKNQQKSCTERASSGQKRLPKRPLFTCVPFSSKKQKTEDCSSNNKLEEKSNRRQAGRLFSMKQQNGKKKRLSQYTCGRSPCSYSREQIYNFGVSNEVLDITSENAQCFVFGRDFFIEETPAKASITVGDGAKLDLGPEGTACLTEFKNAFRTVPGVDNSLFNEEWLANQYRWIVWKLASMERSFPEMFAGRCLTPNEVMYHLKYRYDKEIDSAERPALKKILERDDVSSRRLVLCISRIYPSGQDSVLACGDEKSDGKEKKIDNQKCIVELTDGWYPVKAALDKPLSHLLNLQKIFIGMKLCVYGADLIGSEDATPPLEAPNSLMLALHANSTRRARWDAKLGFQTDRRAFPVPLYSLFPDGGLVGCIDVVILRSYPVQWMEKCESGCVFRNSTQERKAAKKYNEQKQIRMENLYAKIQKELENSQPKVTRQSKRRRSLNPSSKELQAINNGQELYEILNSTSDPASLEIMLSDSQKELVAQFRLRKDEEQQSLMQRKFDDAWKEIQEVFPERCVISLQKFRVTDYKLADRKPRLDSFVTVWKPKEEMRLSWKEGARLKIFNLSASSSRYKHTKSAVQLATMNTTRYEELKTEPNALDSFYSKRKITPFSELKLTDRSDLNELDVVGYVVFIEQHGAMSELQTVYIADSSDAFVAIKVWGGLKAFSLEEIICPGSLVCIQNLVLKPELHYGAAIIATYCDLSSACRHPKELHLKQAAEELQFKIQDVPTFLKERREFLRTKLHTGSRGVRMTNTPKSHNQFQGTTPEVSSGKTTPNGILGKPTATDQSSVGSKFDTPKQHQACEKDVLTSINASCSSDCKDSIVLDAQKKLNDIKRRALARYGEPSGLGSSPANITPKARRAFKPPSLRKT